MIEVSTRKITENFSNNSLRALIFMQFSVLFWLIHRSTEKKYLTFIYVMRKYSYNSLYMGFVYSGNKLNQFRWNVKSMDVCSDIVNKKWITPLIKNVTFCWHSQHFRMKVYSLYAKHMDCIVINLLLKGLNN